MGRGARYFPSPLPSFLPPPFLFLLRRKGKEPPLTLHPATDLFVLLKKMVFPVYRAQGEEGRFFISKLSRNLSQQIRATRESFFENEYSSLASKLVWELRALISPAAAV